MTWILYLAIAALFCVILLMAVAIMDLRLERDAAKADVDRWKDEAKKLGWKDAFSQANDALASLAASADVLKEAAATMRRVNALQRENAEELRGATSEMSKANGLLRSSTDRLERASAAFTAATAKLRGRGAFRHAGEPASPPAGGFILPAPDDDGVGDVVRRIEAQARAGQIETDPKKFN
jgi:hypothetical protein